MVNTTFLKRFSITKCDTDGSNLRYTRHSLARQPLTYFGDGDGDRDGVGDGDEDGDGGHGHGDGDGDEDGDEDWRRG